jgi:hypothetical protein
MYDLAPFHRMIIINIPAFAIANWPNRSQIPDWLPRVNLPPTLLKQSQLENQIPHPRDSTGTWNIHFRTKRPGDFSNVSTEPEKQESASDLLQLTRLNLKTEYGSHTSRDP